ncbi:hypothetical protein KGO95_00990 [Patescibacteria group bacterium]|nr:hypothetical protein [Patescibacteria group bacterium]
MTDDEAKELVLKLAAEMRDILKENFLKNPALTDAAAERVAEIRDEIESMGFMIQWQAGADLYDPSRVFVTIELFEPKKNLSPEDQKIYNKFIADAVIRKNRKKNS